MAENESDSAVTKLTYLLIGGGIGAIIALLFAPKSGRELRGDIAEVTKKGIDYSAERAKQLGQTVDEYYERGREKAADLYEVGREKASKAVESGKDIISSKTEAYAAAIEAGKQAYRETKSKGRAATEAGEES